MTFTPCLIVLRHQYNKARGGATVATNGVIAPVSAGTATITATTQDGNKTATCIVTVAAP